MQTNVGFVCMNMTKIGLVHSYSFQWNFFMKRSFKSFQWLCHFIQSNKDAKL